MSTSETLTYTVQVPAKHAAAFEQWLAEHAGTTTAVDYWPEANKQLLLKELAELEHNPSEYISWEESKGRRKKLLDELKAKNEVA